MRKIILSMMTTLDGYIAGPNDDLSWHHVDDEWNAYAIELINSVDTILFGRTNYQLFESYWPATRHDPNSSPVEHTIGEFIDEAHKIVFSKTLPTVNWKNTELKHDVIFEEINTLKQASGKDIVIFGGARIARSFMKLGLIDEYRLFINPIVLGNGKPLFDESIKMNLKLISTKIFKSGLVGLYYQPN